MRMKLGWHKVEPLQEKTSDTGFFVRARTWRPQSHSLQSSFKFLWNGLHSVDYTLRTRISVLSRLPRNPKDQKGAFSFSSRTLRNARHSFREFKEFYSSDLPSPLQNEPPLDTVSSFCNALCTVDSEMCKVERCAVSSNCMQSVMK